MVVKSVLIVTISEKAFLSISLNDNVSSFCSSLILATILEGSLKSLLLFSISD